MKKIIVANWKMNPTSPKEARSIFMRIRNKGKKLRKVKTVVCAPFVYLEALAKIAHGASIGAQDTFWETEGARTGEVSPAMLKEIGARYCIIGHSERRALGETNEDINKKIKLAIDYRLIVILCVGERERDEEGAYLDFLKEELVQGLEGLPRRYFENLIIAYEPIWAIGEHAKGASTPADFLEQSIFVRKVLTELTTRGVAMSVPILYGGSVSEANAEGFLREGKADGLLVGRASLEPERFNEILDTANRTKGA